MKSLTIRVLCVGLALSILACGSNNPTAPGNSGIGSGSTSGGGGNSATCTVPGSTATGTMTALVNGVAWKALCVGVSTAAQGLISIAGGENTTATTGTTIAFAATRAVGTTTIGPSSPTNATLTVGGLALWQAVLSIGSGTLTFTTLTANNATGTFAFSMTAAPGSTATGTKTVTSGLFNITF